MPKREWKKLPLTHTHERMAHGTARVPNPDQREPRALMLCHAGVKFEFINKQPLPAAANRKSWLLLKYGVAGCVGRISLSRISARLRRGHADSPILSYSAASRFVVRDFNFRAPRPK